MSGSANGPAVQPLHQCWLYGILDLGYCPRENLASMTKAMLAGGIDILQLRAKGYPEAEIVAVAREIRPLLRDAGVPFIINDHPAIAQEVGADGVHVGQDDLSLAEVRRLFPRGLVGRSTHSVAQARAGAAEGADYLGFGPLFATPTKPDYTPIGLDDIRQVHEELSLPIFCIGGVKAENLPTILAAGARRVVIVSGILSASNPADYAAEAKKTLTNHSSERPCAS